jgi:hypothetical protein
VVRLSAELNVTPEDDALRQLRSPEKILWFAEGSGADIGGILPVVQILPVTL